MGAGANFINDIVGFNILLLNSLFFVYILTTPTIF